MKIAFFTTTLESGGAERHLLQLAQHWPLPRENLEIVLLERRGVWLSEVPKGVRVTALSEKAPKVGAFKYLWAWRQVSRVRKLFKDQGYDVVVTFLWLPTVVAALALKGLPHSNRPRLVWSVQSDLDQEFRLHADGWLRRWVIQSVLPSQVERYIAISSGIAQRTQRLLGVPKERFEIIPNSIDVERILNLSARQDNIPPKNFSLRIVSIGRLHPAKGFDLLLDALARLRIRVPHLNFEAWIVGEGPERSNLETQIQKLGIGKWVKLAGHTTNPYAWMASADLLVSSSRWEAFGIVIAEALAVGCPVVATATDGACDIIEHGKDGWIVPIEDPQALADGLYKVLTDKRLRENLSKRGKEKAKQFDIPFIAQRYVEEIQKVLRDPLRKGSFEK